MARLKKYSIDFRKLAKIFNKHDFFNDYACMRDDLDFEIYGVLCVIYGALDEEGKHILRALYDSEKRQQARKTEKGGC